jgi:hypothetical protein
MAGADHASASKIAARPPASLQMAPIATPTFVAFQKPAAKQPHPLTEAELLRDAYKKLKAADKDYEGHRAKAVKHVEAAAKLLGVDLNPVAKRHEPEEHTKLAATTRLAPKAGEKNHETQSVSDEHLRAAQKLLAEASGPLSGEALKQVDSALKELDLALKIR